MGRALGQTAQTLDCSERTLRRYINGGLLRGRALNSHRLELPEQEQRYARSHWDLLHGLRAALRTERDVRMAVLFGSTSTGEDTPDSDLDLLVCTRRDEALPLAGLQQRLSDTLGRHVHLIRLEDARRSANLLADILAEGRTVIDRDGLWPQLLGEQPRVLRAAAREDDETLALARTAVDAAARRLGD